MADKGTILLDEIGEMTPHLQAKLLHVLQDSEYSRLGGKRTVRVDARVLASTNVNLEEHVSNGKFREDLYFRLNVIRVAIPPLRERREDIPQLAKGFLARRKRGIDDAAMQLLLQHRWPGNVRELHNAIDRAVLLEESDTITPQSLPAFSDDPVEAAAEQQWTLGQLEARYIREVLRQTRSNYSRAAEILGINRKTLLEKRRKYGIE